MSNVVFTCPEFYISYVETRGEFARMCDDLCAAFGRPEPKDLPETALCVRDATKSSGVRYLILYGDHRPQYADLAPKGLQPCIDYFVANMDQIGHSSDTLDVLPS